MAVAMQSTITIVATQWAKVAHNSRFHIHLGLSVQRLRITRGAPAPRAVGCMRC